VRLFDRKNVKYFTTNLLVALVGNGAYRGIIQQYTGTRYKIQDTRYITTQEEETKHTKLHFEELHKVSSSRFKLQCKDMFKSRSSRRKNRSSVNEEVSRFVRENNREEKQSRHRERRKELKRRCNPIQWILRLSFFLLGTSTIFVILILTGAHTAYFDTENQTLLESWIDGENVNHTLAAKIMQPPASALSFTSPLRSEEDKILSQACVRSGQGGIYIKHFRKAGGSSVTMIATKNACRRRKEHVENFIPVYGSELPYFNHTHSFGVHAPSMVFITALRDPIERIISLYWFEGRWPRICDSVCEGKREKTNETAVADFAEWIERVHNQNDYPDRRLKLTYHNNCGQWQSVENYYIRQLLAVDRMRDKNLALRDDEYFNNVTITRDHLEKAKRVLAAFDLVVDIEELGKDPELELMLYEITGGSKRRPAKEPKSEHSRINSLRKTHFFPPTKTELDRLRDLNAFDIELYEYAKLLNRDTVKRWVERENNHTNSVNQTALDRCKRPPLALDQFTKPILLGGLGCENSMKPFFYSGSAQHCNLHSGVVL